MENDKKKIVALYDFRSMQAYIFRTDKMKEIIGASSLITKMFDTFLNELEKQEGIRIKRNYSYHDGYYENEQDNSMNNYDGEVIYIGGGNLYMIYNLKELFILANQFFSKFLLEQTYSLKVICSYTNKTENFADDRKRLYENNIFNKNIEPISIFNTVLPISRIDRKNALPISKEKTVKYGNTTDILQLSMESFHKLNEYENLIKNTKQDMGITKLDELVTLKGSESLIAIIHIDGNNMGEKIKQVLGKEQDYHICTEKMRDFSNEIQKNFVTIPLEEIKKKLIKLNSINNNEHVSSPYRFVIGGGDEITIICNARHAMSVIMTYFDTLKQSKKENSNNTYYTACAGIALCHVSTPFIDIYNVAQECCDNAKKANRQVGGNNNFIDFHFNYSGLENGLEKNRKTPFHYLLPKPYCIEENVSGTVSLATFLSLGKELSKLPRHYVKHNLVQAIIKGNSFFETELIRIKAFPEYRNLLISKEQKELIFNIYSVLDLGWFDDLEVKRDETTENNINV